MNSSLVSGRNVKQPNSSTGAPPAPVVPEMAVH
jgi:hypothetical protein